MVRHGFREQTGNCCWFHDLRIDSSWSCAQAFHIFSEVGVHLDAMRMRLHFECTCASTMQLCSHSWLLARTYCHHELMLVWRVSCHPGRSHRLLGACFLGGFHYFVNVKGAIALCVGVCVCARRCGCSGSASQCGTSVFCAIHACTASD